MKKIYLYLIVMLYLCMNTLFAQRIITLVGSKQLALKNNARSKNGKLEIEASKQVRKSAFTKYFPDISAGGLIWNSQKYLMEIETHGGNLPVYDGNLANLANATQYAYFPSSTMGLMKKGSVGFINIVQPIFAGGRIYNGNRLAALGEEVSEFKDKLTRNEISLKTEEQYWLIVSLEEKSKTIEKYEELLKSLLRQVEDAYKSGIVMRNDVLKVKLKLSEILLNKSKLDNGKNLAKLAFCQHIGISFDSTLVFSDELEVKDNPQSIYIDKLEALKMRTEYSLLEKSVEAEELQTRLKLGEFLPQVGVGLSGMFMKLDESKDRTFGMVFGSLSIPISGWWGASYELKERAQKEQIAENNFKDNTELLILQIEKAWRDLNDSYKQYLLSEESRVQSEENLKVNDDSYRNGLVTISDLLEAQAMAQQVSDQLIESKANYKNKTSYYLIVTGRSR